MKKFFALALVITTLAVFVSCSNKTEVVKLLDKEGIAPYELSEHDTYLLQALPIQGDIGIISFKAPKAANSLKAKAYILEDDSRWRTIGEGQILLEQDASSNAQLEGTFTLLLREDYSIAMQINAMGLATYQTEVLDIDCDIISFSKGFLTDFQEIELNKEIPVAIAIYDSGTSIRSYLLDSFYSPSVFEGMDLVQVVTLTFIDKVD